MTQYALLNLFYEIYRSDLTAKKKIVDLRLN